jgi:hypothetical protein
MEKEYIIRDVNNDQLHTFKAILEADGYSVTVETQPDGLFTLRAQNSDIQPVESWPKPGKS